MKNKMKNNLFKILLNDKNVNNYTKALIIILQMNYFDKIYIPNKLLMNKLNINKYNASRLIKQLENNKVIRVRYYENKRYITIVDNPEYNKNLDYFDNYDWLSEEEEL